MEHIFSSILARPWIWSIAACLVASGIYVFIGTIVGEANAIMLIIAIGITVAIITSHTAGAMMLALIFPLSSTYLLPRKLSGISGLNVLNIMIILFTLTSLIKFFSQFEKPIFPKLSAPLLAFAALVAVAGIRGAIGVSSIPDYYVELGVIPSKSQAEFLHIYIFKPFITFLVVWLVAFFVANSSKPGAIVYGMVGAGTIISLAVVTYAVGSGAELHNLASQESRRYLSGIGMHANELGLMLNTIFLMVLLMAFSVRDFYKRVIIYFILISLLMSTLLTFSRGAYLGTLTAICFALAVRRKVFLTMIFVAGIAAIFIFFPSSIERPEDAGQPVSAESLSSGRLTDIWEPLIPELVNNIIVGGGASYIMRSDAAKNESILPVGHPHSAYLEALLDVGLLGSLIILLFGFYAWRLYSVAAAITPGEKLSQVLRGGQGSLLILLVQGATDDSFLPTRSHVFIWLAYGAAWGIHAKFATK